MVARACEDLEPLRVAIEKAREALEGLKMRGFHQQNSGVNGDINGAE